MWQALRAVGQPSSAAEREAAEEREQLTDELIEQLPHLWEAVWQAAEGRDPDLQTFPYSMPVRRLLDDVRRSFLHLARTCGSPLPAGEMIRALAALDQVQHAYDRSRQEHFTAKLSAPSGLDLVVDVAHDMRSPLTSILFLVEMIRKGQSGPLTKLQERQLGLVWSAAFALGSVVTDVVDLVRINRLLDPRPTPFSVSELMQSCRDIVQPIAEEKGLSLDLVHPPESHRVGHPAALHRVLLNLTTNALKFTRDGLVLIAARDTAPARLEFSVRDSGRGIPDAVLGQLFEPLRPQASTGEQVFSSAGLGLAICRKLVRAMGSDLRVVTQEGVGTQFSFELELPIMSRE